MFCFIVAIIKLPTIFLIKVLMANKFLGLLHNLFGNSYLIELFFYFKLGFIKSHISIINSTQASSIHDSILAAVCYVGTSLLTSSSGFKSIKPFLYKEHEGRYTVVSFLVREDLKINSLDKPQVDWLKLKNFIMEKIYLIRYCFWTC